MTFDDSKAAFSSTWEIDQLIVDELVDCTVGTTAVHTFIGTDIPLVEVQFQRAAGSSYYNAGQNLPLNTVASLFTFYSYIQNNTVYVVTTESGTAHIMIWEDKINY